MILGRRVHMKGPKKAPQWPKGARLRPYEFLLARVGFKIVNVGVVWQKGWEK